MLRDLPNLVVIVGFVESLLLFYLYPARYRSLWTQDRFASCVYYLKLFIASTICSADFSSMPSTCAKSFADRP